MSRPIAWLRDALAVPERAFPEFPAVLSVMVVLSPGVIDRLEERATRLRADVDQLEAELLRTVAIPRLFLIEDEYRLTQRKSELEWVLALIEDLRAARVTWNEEWLRSVAAAADSAGQTRQ